MPIRRNDAPLIVTAVLDPAAFAALDALRRRHFPAALNKVPAHVSLFHQLPGGAEAEIVRDAGRVTENRPGLTLRARGVRFLGRGVAIAYDGHGLDALHADLAARWSAWLTAQDRQPFRPHVTIQNKVTPERARALFEAMQEAPLPDCRIEGLAIWRYLGGPWEAVAERRFG